MTTRKSYVVTTLAIGIVAFLMGANAPLGRMVWPAMPGDLQPSVLQLGLFMFYTAIVALGLGFGIAYWMFGRRFTENMFPRMTGAAHVALGYIPASFWLHDNLHMVNGENINGLIAIEYLFHVPMILVGVVLIAATIQSVQARRSGPAYAATA